MLEDTGVRVPAVRRTLQMLYAAEAAPDVRWGGRIADCAPSLPAQLALSEAGAAPRPMLPNPLRTAQPAARMSISIKARDPTTGTS